MTVKAKSSKVVEIDADVWAESGGTGGIYGANWRNGTLRIVSDDGAGNRTVIRKSKFDE